MLPSVVVLVVVVATDKNKQPCGTVPHECMFLFSHPFPGE
jgi:hypothetical protein